MKRPFQHLFARQLTASLLRIRTLALCLIFGLMPAGILAVEQDAGYRPDDPSFYELFGGIFGGAYFPNQTIANFDPAPAGRYASYIVLADGHVAFRLRQVIANGSRVDLYNGWLLSTGQFVRTARFLTNANFPEYARAAGGYVRKQSASPATLAAGASHLQLGLKTQRSEIQATFSSEFIVPANYDTRAVTIEILESFTATGPNTALSALYENGGSYGIRGCIWNDPNFNGSIDLDEGGRGGVLLRLRNSANPSEVVAETGTSNGTYSFRGLEPGTYVVDMNQPLDTKVTQIGLSPDTGPTSDHNAFPSVGTVHNNRDAATAWTTVVTSVGVTVGPDNPVPVVNGGLIDLPIVSLLPALLSIPEPTATGVTTAGLDTIMDRPSDGVITLFFNRTPGPGMELTGGQADLEVPSGAILSSISAGPNRGLLVSHPINVFRDSRAEGPETVLMDVDLSRSPVSSRSVGATIVIEEAPVPTGTSDTMSALYTGFMGATPTAPSSSSAPVMDLTASVVISTNLAKLSSSQPR